MKTLFASALWIACQLPFSSLRSQYFYNAWYYNYSLVWEAGVAAGPMNCLTDIGGRKGRGGPLLKDVDWRSFRPCFSGYLSATYKEVFTLRLEAFTGHIGAGDSVLKAADPDRSGRYGRNLSFRSSINEIQLAAEIHPLYFGFDEQGNTPFFSPYLVAGLSYFSFNPQATLNGQWHDLHPLRLEGQGSVAFPKRQPYQLSQWAIPLGLGLRYETGPLVNLRMEFLYRKLFTDYLDDVSTTYIDPAHFIQYLDPGPAAIARQLYNRMDELRPARTPAPGAQRGNAKNKDAYFSLQLKVGYVFRTKVR